MGRKIPKFKRALLHGQLVSFDLCIQIYIHFYCRMYLQVFGIFASHILKDYPKIYIFCAAGRKLVVFDIRNANNV